MFDLHSYVCCLKHRIHNITQDVLSVTVINATWIQCVLSPDMIASLDKHLDVQF